MTFKEIEAQHPGFKAWAREAYIGNECGSDEYRETQPFKGLKFIADWAGIVENASAYGDALDPDRHPEVGVLPMLRLVKSWLDKILWEHSQDHTDEPWIKAYAGAEELEPVLGLVFDALWEAGEHPYGYEPEELLPWYLEDKSRA